MNEKETYFATISHTIDLYHDYSEKLFQYVPVQPGNTRTRDFTHTISHEEWCESTHNWLNNFFKLEPLAWFYYYDIDSYSYIDKETGDVVYVPNLAYHLYDQNVPKEELRQYIRKNTVQSYTL